MKKNVLKMAFMSMMLMTTNGMSAQIARAVIWWEPGRIQSLLLS